MHINTVFLVKDRDSDYTLYDVYNYGKIQGGNLIVHEVGSWDVDNGLHFDINLNGYKYYRRWDFQNITMRMILVVSTLVYVLGINMIKL